MSGAVLGSVFAVWVCTGFLVLVVVALTCVLWRHQETVGAQLDRLCQETEG